MEPGNVRLCPCGGLIQRIEAVVGCRKCGTVYAMYLSMETRSPAKYDVASSDERPSVVQPSL